MIKLIVSDFDGTLCENGRISDLTLGKISDLVASNKLFTVSSGRDITELYDFFRDLKSKISFIAFDGALAVCNNHTVFHVPFSIETLSRVTADTEDNVVRFIGAENSWCFNDKNNSFSEDIHITKSFQIKEHIYKIVFYGQRSEKEFIGARLHYSD
jgi:HAD superfamily hydrolase (TIGR01484 family)